MTNPEMSEADVDDSTQTKACAQCGRQVPLVDFYRRSVATDGRGSTCKPCLAVRRRTRRAMTDEDRLLERESLANRKAKSCSACGVEKPREEFRTKPRRASRDGLAPKCKACESDWRRSHYQANREVVLEQSAAWYAANRERMLKVRQAYYQANKERAAAYRRKWNAENPEWRARLTREWRAANRDRAQETDRAWYAANRDHIREQSREAYARNPIPHIDASHRRRALIAERQVGPIDYTALWTGLCGLCGNALDPAINYPDPLSKSVDHILPLALGGHHTQDNVQWTHLFCNVSKGARTPDALLPDAEQQAGEDYPGY